MGLVQNMGRTNMFKTILGRFQILLGCLNLGYFANIFQRVHSVLWDNATVIIIIIIIIIIITLVCDNTFGYFKDVSKWALFWIRCNKALTTHLGCLHDLSGSISSHIPIASWFKE